MHPIACPKTSIWIAANAGSGKTKVLVDRLLSLLLQNISSSNILCITFTKAGASEMTQRVQNKLLEWATLDENILIQQLQDLTGIFPSPEFIERARGLIFQVLEKPIPIHTIHAFCQKLLKQFPLEAGVSPYFSVIDERDAQVLMTQAMTQMLDNKLNDSELEQAFSLLAPSLEKNTFFELLVKITQDRNKLDLLQNLRPRLYDLLNIPEGLTREAYLSEVQGDNKEFITYITRIFPDLTQGKPTDEKVLNTLQAYIAHPQNPEAFDAYKGLFFTTAGEPRQKFATQGITNKHPDLTDFVNQERERLAELEDMLQSIDVATYSMALNTLAQRFLDVYKNLKTLRNVLDYNDLISHTKHLLGDQDLAAWVRYKIDNQIHHILVDEAQDTNYDQWDITRALTDEFFADTSGQLDPRSILTVGDEKQSIYGFQGAEPQAFRKMQQTYHRDVTASAHQWHEIQLLKSYRSAPAIINTVDRVFQNLGYTTISHQAHKTHPGCVTLWPCVHPMESTSQEAWSLMPVQDYMEDEDRLAVGIANTVHLWISQKRILQGQNRPIEPRDIMILVRRRNALFEALIRALKSKGIAVSGPDRFILNDHLAIQDVIALFRFLCLPNDDFNLACLLKSPFFGWSEDDLFNLAWDRPDSLWTALCAQDSDTQKTLAQFLDAFQQSGPFLVFSQLLYGQGYLEKFVARMSTEVVEVFAQFSDICLDYEANHTPSLYGFLAWFDDYAPEIKRDSSTTLFNQVRIMTVHGAKGLESPIVILPDTTQTPKEDTDYLIDKKHKCLLWLPKKVRTPKILTNLRQAQAQETKAEHERLLYVAMTRAEEELYITGIAPKTGIKDDSWYTTIASIMPQDCLNASFSLQGIDGDTYCHRDIGFTYTYAPTQPNIDASEPPLVPWLHTLAKHERPRIAVAPSDIEDQELPEPSIFVPEEEKVYEDPGMYPYVHEEGQMDFSPNSGAERRRFMPHWTLNFQGRERGITFHKILEILGGQPCNLWDTLLGPIDPDMEDVKNLAYDLLQDPHLSFLFTNPGLNEVSFEEQVEKNGKLYVIAGQMDRVVFLPDRIVIVDYKTTPNVPDQIPESYKTQMSYYRTAMSKIYPDTPIECAVLWTHTRSLVYVPDQKFHDTPNPLHQVA